MATSDERKFLGWDGTEQLVATVKNLITESNTSFKNGDGSNSMVYNVGDANGDYSIAGGTNDKEIVKDIIGNNLAAALVSVDVPTANGDMSVSFGAGTKTHAAGAMALGVNSQAGCKGLYWTAIDFNTKKITLSTTQRSQTKPSSIPWSKRTTVLGAVISKGDIISITNDDRYINCAEILDIDTSAGTITVDSLPFTAIATPDTTYPNDYAVFVVDKPDKGDVEFGWGAYAHGYDNVAAGTLSFTSGYGNRAASDFSAVFGRDNVGGYASLVSGSNNKVLGDTGYSEGAGNTNTGNKAHTEGANNTNSGNMSHVEGLDNTNSGSASHVEGYNNNNTGSDSHVEGDNNDNRGAYSHVEGLNHINNGERSHVEGCNNANYGSNSHVEGYLNEIAAGNYNHLEGEFNVVVDGIDNHIEGTNNAVTGSKNHVEGQGHLVESSDSTVGRNHVQGYVHKVYAKNSHVSGVSNEVRKSDDDGADVNNANVSGYHNIGNGSHQHVAGKYNNPVSNRARITGGGTSEEDRKNIEELDWDGNVWFAGSVKIGGTGWNDAAAKEIATQEYVDEAVQNISVATGGVGQSFSDGCEIFNDYSDNVASGVWSHAEGYDTRSTGTATHAEGDRTTASGAGAHAEGVASKAIGDGSHAEGANINNSGSTLASWTLDDGTVITGNVARGTSSHVEGAQTYASGWAAHAEGRKTIASYTGAHAEGVITTSSGYGSHAEGNYSNATGEASHAEGFCTEARGARAHAEGQCCVASGNFSHAEGENASAFGTGSHAEGYQTKASGQDQHVQGRLNIEDTDGNYAHIVGGGNKANWIYRNIHTLDWSGNASFAGVIASQGADYAEFFEWQDGNPANEDRVGLAVSLDGDKIKLAESGDDVLGIISGTAAILGDNAEWEWKQKYLLDDFGRIRYEEVEQFIDVREVDHETGDITVVKKSLGMASCPMINPDYDDTKTYVSRAKRPEWGVVGMFGKLYVRDDGTCVVNGHACVGDSGVVTASDARTNLRVLKRVTENIVQVLLK